MQKHIAKTKYFMYNVVNKIFVWEVKNMSKIIVKEIDYDIWGKCISVSDGKIELLATTKVGPRIIRFGFVGGENILFEDREENFSRNDKELSYYKEGCVWHIFGGHRLWNAPELMPRTYIPDDSPVEYEILKNGVRLIQPINEKIGVLNEIEITMSEDGEVKITHKVTNKNMWKIKTAPWAITAVNGGGLEVIPLSKEKSGLLNNRVISLWDYTNLDDGRAKIYNDCITLKTNENDCTKDIFKIGTNNSDGYMMYFYKNNLFVKEFDYESGAEYPDGGCNSETYTNNKLIEIESVGALKWIDYNETLVHIEKWKLYGDVKMPSGKEDIDFAVKKYMR